VVKYHYQPLPLKRMLLYYDSAIDCIVILVMKNLPFSLFYFEYITMIYSNLAY